MGFFVRGLYEDITEVYSEQYGGHHHHMASFTVYRGQGLTQIELNQLMKSKGGLTSFNSFLSTTSDRDVAFSFAEDNVENPDLFGVLFQINLDPSISSTCFGNVENVCYLKTEKEVLFSMHSVFRVGQIKQIHGNNRLWQVDLTWTSDKDPQLHALIERMRAETFPHLKGWHRLGSLLLKLSQPDKAQDVYQILLEQASSDREKAPIYHNLGMTKYKQGKYKEAMIFYEKSLEIDHKTLPPNHPDLAISYSSIGLVHDKMGDYSKALLSHGEALGIKKQNLPPYHPDLATSYSNIGGVYNKMGDYEKALSYYNNAHGIFLKALLPNHPDLATSYSNIGELYNKMGNYDQALFVHKEALEMLQKTLPPGHPSLAIAYNNIGALYNKMGNYPEALFFHEKSVGILQKSIPADHPDLATSYNNICSVYIKIGD
jgi:tetratricopeptide (TPR) repeat protein